MGGAPSSAVNAAKSLSLDVEYSVADMDGAISIVSVLGLSAVTAINNFLAAGVLIPFTCVLSEIERTLNCNGGTGAPAPTALHCGQ